MPLSIAAIMLQPPRASALIIDPGFVQTWEGLALYVQQALSSSFFNSYTGGKYWNEG